MAKRDIWVIEKWINPQGIPVQRKRKKLAYWEKGATYPQDRDKRRTLKSLSKQIYKKGGISLKTFNQVAAEMMGRKSD